MIARTTNGIANFDAQLNGRLVHLRFELLFERNFSAFEDFVNVRTQLARLGVGDRELLYDSQSERVFLHAMKAARNVPRKQRTVIPSAIEGSRCETNGKIAGFFDFASLGS